MRRPIYNKKNKNKHILAMAAMISWTHSHTQAQTHKQILFGNGCNDSMDNSHGSVVKNAVKKTA
jgi:predicted esterase